jgi:hypothetical protein
LREVISSISLPSVPVGWLWNLWLGNAALKLTGQRHRRYRTIDSDDGPHFKFGQALESSELAQTRLAWISRLSSALAGQNSGPLLWSALAWNVGSAPAHCPVSDSAEFQVCYEHVTWAAAMHRRRPPRPCLRPFNMQKLLLLRYQTHSTSSETTPPTVLGQLSAALPRRQWKGVSCGPGPGTAGCILVTLCLVVTTLDRGRANLSPRHRGVASMTTGSRSGDSGMLEYVVLCGHGGQLGRHHLTRTTGPNFRTRWPGSRVK